MSAQAERALLAAALLDPSVVSEATVQPSDFSRPQHENLWALMRTMQETGTPPNPEEWFVDVVDRVASKPSDYDGVAYVTGLPTGHSSPASVVDCWPAMARQVARASRRNALRDLALGMVEEMKSDPTADAADVAARAELRLSEIIRGGSPARPGTITLAEGMLAAFQDATTSDAQHCQVFPTGLPRLDELFSGGMRESDLVVLGARPSMGKSALAFQVAFHVARSHTVLIFSMEMAREAVSQRALARYSSVPLQDIRRRSLSLSQVFAMTKAVEDATAARVHIHDRAGLSIGKIAGEARRIAAASPDDAPLGLVVVDYLQLADAVVGKGARRDEVTAAVSRGLKQIARELRVPVLALAQLNREVDTRTDHIPQLSDLRESGQIEQDADAILFLWRPIRYDVCHPDPALAHLILAKQRNGPTEEMDLDFDGGTQTFTERGERGAPAKAERPELTMRAVRDAIRILARRIGKSPAEEGKLQDRWAGVWLAEVNLGDAALLAFAKDWKGDNFPSPNAINRLANNRSAR